MGRRRRSNRRRRHSSRRSQQAELEIVGSSDDTGDDSDSDDSSESPRLRLRLAAGSDSSRSKRRRHRAPLSVELVDDSGSESESDDSYRSRRHRSSRRRSSRRRHRHRRRHRKSSRRRSSRRRLSRRRLSRRRSSQRDDDELEYDVDGGYNYFVAPFTETIDQYGNRVYNAFPNTFGHVYHFHGGYPRALRNSGPMRRIGTFSISYFYFLEVQKASSLRRLSRFWVQTNLKSSSTRCISCFQWNFWCILHAAD